MESEEARVLNGQLQTIELSALVDNLASSGASGIQSVLASNPQQDDQEKKKLLLNSLHETRQKLLRLLVLVQWSNKAKAVLEVSNVLEKASTHANTLREAADQLYHQHNDPALIRAPPYDMNTALDVLQTGSYDLLPAIIEESLRGEKNVTPKRKASAIQIMNQTLRSKLLKEDLPVGLTVENVENGAVELRNENDFNIKLILVPGPPQQGEIQIENADNANLDSSGNVKAEKMEIDGPERSQTTNSNLDSTENAQQKSKNDDKWRWRISSFTLLPGEKRRAWLTPKQSAFLQENTDQMMWEAADQNSIGIVRSEETGELNPERIVGKNDPVEEALNEEKPQGLQKNSIASASGISDSGKSSGSRTGLPVIPHQEATKEPVKPLDLMQKILRSSAHRLVILEAMRWAQKQLQDNTQRWHGLIKREKGQELLGGRISYWPGISFLSPLEIQNLGNDMTLFGLKSSQPAIELGLNPNGLLESRHSPSLSLINSDGNFGGDLRFEIEMHTADMQGLILQAASKNADLQLGAILQKLRALGEIKLNNGEILFQTSEETNSHPSPGSVESYSSGVLEFRCGGKSLLKISIQLTTGDLLLRAGASVQDSGEVAAHIRQEEQKIGKLQRSTPPGDFKFSAGIYVLNQICELLGKLYIQLSLRQHFISQASLMTSFGLIQVPVPQRLFKAHWQENRWAPTFKKHVLVFAFPPSPPFQKNLSSQGPNNLMKTGEVQTPILGTPQPVQSPLNLQQDLRSAGLNSPAMFQSPSPNIPGSPQINLQSGLQNGVQNAPRPESHENMETKKNSQDIASMQMLRARNILGKEGSGFQTLLCSELIAGMTWQYTLVLLACNSLGQPIRVLQMKRLPGKPRNDSSSTQINKKRKREDDLDTHDNVAQTTEENDAYQEKESHVSSEYDVDLKDIVRRASKLSLFEQIAFQLQVMGISFLRSHNYGSKKGKLDHATSFLGPQTPNEYFFASTIEGVQGSKPTQAINLKDSGESRKVERHKNQRDNFMEENVYTQSFLLSDFPGKDDLSALQEEGDEDPRIEIIVWMSGSDSVRSSKFTLRVYSRVLGRLPYSQSPDSGNTLGSLEGKLSVNEEGLSLTYSSGVAVSQALSNLGGIIRTQTIFRRLQILCSSDSQQNGSSSPQIQEILHWTEASRAQIDISLSGPSSVSFRVHPFLDPSKPLEPSETSNIVKTEVGDDTLMSLEVQKPKTPPTVFGMMSINEDSSVDQDAMPPPISLASEGYTSNIFGETFRMNSMDLAQFRRQQTAKNASQALKNEQESQLPEIFDSEAIMEISASWNREDEIEGVSSETQLRRNKRKLGKAEEAGIKGLDERKPKRCKILTQPTLPKEILDGFAENLDENEEISFLEVLAQSVEPISGLFNACQAKRLAEYGLKTANVTFKWIELPQKAQIWFEMANSKGILLDFAITTSGYTWIEVKQVEKESSQVKAGDNLGQTSREKDSCEKILSQCLLIDGVFDSLGRSTKDMEDGKVKNSSQGIWCKSWAVKNVIACLLKIFSASSA